MGKHPVFFQNTAGLHMTSKKNNCWEFMKCGREPGGTNVAEFGVCPAAQDISFDGLNRGKNGGRICWAVGGTFCGGKVQGTFAEKRKSCIHCEFYRQVRKEQGKSGSQSRFLKFISENSDPSFLKQLTGRHFKAGERFITQGERKNTGKRPAGSCLGRAAQIYQQ
jgi:hypothetical protein